MAGYETRRAASRRSKSKAREAASDQLNTFHVADVSVGI